MAIEIDVQRASEFAPLPADGQFELWVQTALRDRSTACLTLRLVDREEMAGLNLRYRGKKGPTNVLAFTAELPDEVVVPLLGDIVICAPVVADEAWQQNKTADDHWAHLTIHGVLHLLGYDHQSAEEAEIMERAEIQLLEQLGIANPYA